jgi:Lsr2
MSGSDLIGLMTSSRIGVRSRLMATVTRTYMIDDLDGSEEDVSTVLFSLDRKDFEIDLSAANAEQLRGKLAKFIDAATPVKPQRGRTTTRKSGPASREQTTAVREWARNNGYEVSERGRISAAVQKAFEEAH